MDCGCFQKGLLLWELNRDVFMVKINVPMLHYNLRRHVGRQMTQGQKYKASVDNFWNGVMSSWGSTLVIFKFFEMIL